MMTAQKLIELLEAIPPATPIEVSSEVVSALKAHASKTHPESANPPYVSESEQDRIDTAIIQRRRKSEKTYSVQEVKQRLGLR